MAPVALIAPIRSYRYYRPGMLRAAREMWHADRGWMAEHPEALCAVQDTLRLHGPRASGDFERPAGVRRSGPWDWHGPKPSRRALEILFAMGEVMVHSRKGGQKVYDLRERVLAEALHGDLPDDADLPSAEERLRFFALHAAEALGVIQPAWLWEYHAVRPDPPAGHTHRLAAQAMLDDLCREGHLMPATIEGLEGPAYLAASLLGSLAAVRAGTATARTTLLSPFDSLIWDRARTRVLFGFDVCFEAYVPPPKRKYGYYCLPILHRNQLVGRVDAKADRAAGTLLLRAVYLEPQTALDEGLVAGLAGAARDLAAFLRLPGTQVALAGHQELAALLGERLHA
jgi:uncharacterized protein YcaQ